MKRVLPFVLVVAVVVVFVATLAFLYRKSQAKPVSYDTETPFVTTIVKKTVATGAIIPRKEVAIKPRVSGIIEQLVVEPGDVLKKDDVIAHIKIIPDMVSLHRAQANVRTAQIMFGNAKRELARYKQLYEKAAISEFEYSRHKHEHQLRAQELRAANDNLQLVKSGATKRAGKVANTIVRTTVAGTVLEVPLKEGASVIESNTFNAGTTLASIADLSDMIFEGKVDESEVAKLKLGMTLEIRIGAIDKTAFEGRLEYVAPKGFEEEGAIQFAIRAALKEHRGEFIRAGYSANADIVLDRRDKVLSIREALLQFDKGTPYVEVATGSQEFQRRELKLGLSDGINVEVLSGVAQADKIKIPRR